MSIWSSRICWATASSDRPSIGRHVGDALELLGDRVGIARMGVGEHVELIAIVRRQHRQAEKAYRVLAEVGRDVSYPQPALRIAIVRVRRRDAP